MFSKIQSSFRELDCVVSIPGPLFLLVRTTFFGKNTPEAIWELKALF